MVVGEEVGLLVVGISVGPMVSGEDVGVLLIVAAEGLLVSLLDAFGVGAGEVLLTGGLVRFTWVGAAVVLEIHGRGGQQGILTLTTSRLSRTAAREVKHSARSRTATLVVKKCIIESKWSERSKEVCQRRLLCLWLGDCVDLMVLRSIKGFYSPTERNICHLIFLLAYIFELLLLRHTACAAQSCGEFSLCLAHALTSGNASILPTHHCYLLWSIKSAGLVPPS